MAMSEEVERSTNKTKEVTDKLLQESDEIGEAGRGFSVVAQEVGHLVSSTKDSLKNVTDVVSCVQTKFVIVDFKITL